VGSLCHAEAGGRGEIVFDGQGCASEAVVAVVWEWMDAIGPPVSRQVRSPVESEGSGYRLW